jgi:catalase
VLYDAVALMISGEESSLLANQPAARDFVADAFVHSKFIAYVESAKPFLTKVVGATNLDDALLKIRGSKDISKFIQKSRSCASGREGQHGKRTQQP